ANAGSQRDLQRRHGGQWLKGKSLDGTMPLGPWITTVDEVADPYDLTVRCTVNGEVLQEASTRQVAFSFERIIAELSWGMTLHAGDVILTGTPPGVGNARTPQVFLKPGDDIVTEVSGLGVLRNRVVERDLSSYQGCHRFGWEADGSTRPDAAVSGEPARPEASALAWWWGQCPANGARRSPECVARPGASFATVFSSPLPGARVGYLAAPREEGVHAGP